VITPISFAPGRKQSKYAADKINKGDDEPTMPPDRTCLTYDFTWLASRRLKYDGDEASRSLFPDMAWKITGKLRLGRGWFGHCSKMFTTL
jgi:hypothetical protein